jgi:hypothetical protein
LDLDPGGSGEGVDTYLETFDDLNASLNGLIAGRGVWCCDGDGACSPAVCSDGDLLTVTLDETTRRGTDGASLRLAYDVEAPNALVSRYDALFSGETFYDLSHFEAFHLWVKGEGTTVGPETRFSVRFTDRDWQMAYAEIAGVSGAWERKTVDLGALEGLDWTAMREVTFIFEHDPAGGGRRAQPLSGTLYIDDLTFWDEDAHVESDTAFLDLVERRAFRYFWAYADPKTGLVRDRATGADVSSIAATGFGLSAICVAEERGWIGYDEAYTRVLTTLNSFYDDPSDPDDFVVSGTRGLFWHFVDADEGTPAGDGVSTIDSALLMAGVLHCRQHFSGTEVATLATSIYEAAEWDWFFDEDQGLLHMRWTPEKAFEYRWHGYNEAMILYLLAIGSPTHPVPASAWASWADSYGWGAHYGHPVLTCPPLFTHQYSHCWVDFRGKRDAYANYFRNSRHATLANRAYARDHLYPEAELWGLTACDGPEPDSCGGKTYRTDLGYPPDAGGNDGTIAPTAAAGSIVFAPEPAMATLRYQYERFHPRLWGLYGLKDALNAQCDPAWIDNDYVGIDVGAMVLMIENYRSGLVWDTFMENQEIAAAMAAVGFVKDEAREPPYLFYREAEAYASTTGGGIAREDHATAWSGKTLQIGTEAGNSAVYTVPVDSGDSMLFGVRYSDDVAGELHDRQLRRLGRLRMG